MIVRPLAVALIVAAVIAVAGAGLAACTEFVELHRPSFVPDALVVDAAVDGFGWPDAADLDAAPVTVDASDVDASPIDAAE